MAESMSQEPTTSEEPTTTTTAEVSPEPTATTTTEASPEPTTEDTARANHRKVREGLVVSTKMDKTAVVAVVERVRHRRYAKTMQVTSHLYAHDEANDAREGDRVRLQETRPL